VSIEESLVAVEDGDGVQYNPSASFSPLDSLRSGQGYEVYVDRPDTLIYPLRAETLADVLDLMGVKVGQYVRLQGRNEMSDGGGGLFKVTESGCEADGGTCFIFDEDLTQVTESPTIDHTNLSWRNTKVRYGPDPEDVIQMLRLHGFGGNRSGTSEPWIDLESGSKIDWGFSIPKKLANDFGDGSATITYAYTSSDRRLERVEVTNAVNPAWWGAPEADANNPIEADAHLRWAAQKAGQIYRNNTFDWVYIDIGTTYYYLNRLSFLNGTKVRGVGPLNSDGFTRGTLKVLPGEAMFWLKNGYDMTSDPDRKRVHDYFTMGGPYFTTDKQSIDKFGMDSILHDGNVRNNMQVFNNLEDYKKSLGIEDWLQDSGGWSGFYAVGEFWNQDATIDIDDVRSKDMGGSGFAAGNQSNEANMNINHLEVKNSRRNHLIYGANGAINDLTIEGQFWGGVPIVDPRGNQVEATYTNLTVKNIETGQFDYNTILAVRQASNATLLVDGFTIDLSNSVKASGSNVSIIAITEKGTEWKNGTIRGYASGNYDRGGSPSIFAHRGESTGQGTPTLLKNVTVKYEGIPMDFYNGDGNPARRMRFEDVTFEAATGVSSTMNEWPLSWAVFGKDPNLPRAERFFHKNLKILVPFERFGGAFNVKGSGGGSHPVDVYFEDGELNNDAGDILRQDGLDANAEGILLLFMDSTQINSTQYSSFHNNFRPENDVKLRNVTDPNGRSSDEIGTYTSDANDEGNDYVLISTNLISRAWERSATVTSGTPSVTSVEVANGDGTLRTDDDTNQRDPYLKVNLDETLSSGQVIDVDWTARVTPQADYAATGLFVARPVSNKSYATGNGPWTIDLRGVASSQESDDKIVYAASSGDTSVVTASVQGDGYTLELTEQSAGTATVTVTGEISGVGTETTTFEVTVE